MINAKRNKDAKVCDGKRGIRGPWGVREYKKKTNEAESKLDNLKPNLK